LQVLEDGRLTDSQGRKVDFKNAVIVLTSNIGLTGAPDDKLGLRQTREDGGKQARYERMKKKVLEDVKKVFKPEFINRLDETVVFQALEIEEITEIVDLLLKKVRKEVEAQGRFLEATVASKEKLAKEGYDPQYGARPLRRAIQRMVEDPLAEEFIRGNVPEGSTVELDYKEGDVDLTFNIRKPGDTAADTSTEEAATASSTN
jgi:ATP-dependent Clp protease ATP-binding subunit ClpC